MTRNEIRATLIEMLDFVTRIYNGELAESEELTEAVFSLLFASIIPHMTEEKRKAVLAGI